MKTLIWAGAGARGDPLLESADLPVVLTWGGADILPTDDPRNCGIVGVCGQPGANKAVAEADGVIVIGSGLHQTQTGGRKLNVVDSGSGSGWGELIGYKYLNSMPAVGAYPFNAMMTRMLPEGTCMVVDGGGTALYTGFQSSYIKRGSRLICSTAISAMGSGLPEAIGACLANDRKLTTCLIGDGSMMFNLQELQTIATLNLPIKIFIVNNGGYLAIKHTQDQFLGGRRYGVGGEDLGLPDFCRVAHAFGIMYSRMYEPDEESLRVVLESNCPSICEWVVAEHKMVCQAFKQEGERYVAQPLDKMSIPA